VIKILYESRSFVVVEKPEELLSVPGTGPGKSDCVISRVKESFPQATGPMTVHRLDLPTSGCMIVALTPDTQRTLSLQFERREVKKEYEAILDGDVEPEVHGTYGRIELATKVDWEQRPKQMVHPEGKIGVTDWVVMRRMTDKTRVLFRPVTGRTHQIRVHASHPDGGLGCPIVGDRFYGDAFLSPRLLLHSRMVEFMNPDTGTWLKVHSKVPF